VVIATGARVVIELGRRVKEDRARRSARRRLGNQHTSTNYAQDQGEQAMDTTETVRRYLDAVRAANGWESLLADDAKFTSFTSPVKEASGKNAFVEATKRFYSKTTSLEVRELIVDGNRACALTRYEVAGATGGKFASDVAEIFTVRNGKINSLSIYFDTAPYSR
jgi:ketosteroid isomerase-like protein